MPEAHTKSGEISSSADATPFASAISQYAAPREPAGEPYSLSPLSACRNEEVLCPEHSWQGFLCCIIQQDDWLCN